MRANYFIFMGYIVSETNSFIFMGYLVSETKLSESKLFHFHGIFSE